MVPKRSEGQGAVFSYHSGSSQLLRLGGELCQDWNASAEMQEVNLAEGQTV